MNLRQDFEMGEQVLIEKRYIFQKMRKHLTLFYQQLLHHFMYLYICFANVSRIHVTFLLEKKYINMSPRRSFKYNDSIPGRKVTPTP